MLFQIFLNEGASLNAHFELSGRTITYHARGGARGEAAINADYGEGLRLLCGDCTQPEERSSVPGWTAVGFSPSRLKSGRCSI